MRARLAVTPILADIPTNDDLQALIAFAQAAEAAGFDLLLIDPAPGLDPLSLAAALCSKSQRIGLGAAAATGHGEPFTLARGFAALDHLSGGRGAWHVLPTQTGADLPAFPLRPPVEAGQAPARAAEFVQVVIALWESWGADAIVFDKAEAVFSDREAIHAVDHTGAFFSVRGPLNTPRPPQGRLPLIHDADAPLALIAETADIVLGRAETLDEAIALHATVKAAAATRDRSPHLLASLTSDTLDRAAWRDHGACDGLNLRLDLGAAGELAVLGRALGAAP
jgi:alkanesulfonate monooxygenase SsuD/methylene tetrahydromethanopterin reductase-like flavin-dependent oxidoreductase (luciferase family)